MEMEDKHLKLYEHKVYDKNPFIKELVSNVIKDKSLRVRKFITQKGGFIDKNTGEIKDVIIGFREAIDGASFTKIFHKQLSALGLSDRAIKLLHYISDSGILKKDETYVELPPEQTAKKVKMSIPTYYRALNDLLNYNVLGKHRMPWRYFINPNYIFNGDRITVINQYIKESTINEKGEYLLWGNGFKQLKSG